MASFTKKSNGTWKVELYINGRRESKTLPTKGEATLWANVRAAELSKSANLGIKELKKCDDVFDKYASEVSIKKKGERWEKVRLTAFGNHKIDGVRFGDILVKDVDTTFMAKFRDMRLKTVKPPTVNREFNLLSHVFTIARKEWKWLSEEPLKDVARPKDPSPRDRRISDDEIEQLRIALGYNGTVRTKQQALYVAFLFAIETAMRQGEIASLDWDSVFSRHAHLSKTKNGDERDVPLSAEAISLLNLLPKESPSCFGLKADYMSTTFRKVREKTLIKDLHFHDTRHEAVTRLAKKLHVLELARMTGHRDIKELMTYYNATAAEISKKL